VIVEGNSMPGEIFNPENAGAARSLVAAFALHGILANGGRRVDRRDNRSGIFNRRGVHEARSRRVRVRRVLDIVRMKILFALFDAANWLLTKAYRCQKRLYEKIVALNARMRRPILPS
jgi:hypothetical protein